MNCLQLPIFAKRASLQEHSRSGLYPRWLERFKREENNLKSKCTWFFKDIQKFNRLYQTIQNIKGEIPLIVKRAKSAETNLSEEEWEFVHQLLQVNTTREIEAGTESIIPSLSAQEEIMEEVETIEELETIEEEYEEEEDDDDDGDEKAIKRPRRYWSHVLATKYLI